MGGSLAIPSVPDIIDVVLDRDLQVMYDAAEMAHEVYEITNETELRSAAHNIRGALGDGKRKGRWASRERGKFQSKRVERQPELSGV